MVELCMLALITTDLASRSRNASAIFYTITITSLLTAAAAVAGEILFYSGVTTRLIGSYGDLVSSEWYARAQAGLYHPNLLASFCIFAISVALREDSAISVRLRRATTVALCVAVVFTFSRGILGFIFAVLVRRANTRKRQAIACGWAAVCLIVVFSFTFWNLSINPTHPLDAHFDMGRQSSRYQAITSSLQKLAAHPLWGSGPGTHPGRYLDRPFDAHFTPLNIAASLGLPSLMAFTSLLTILWRERDRPTDIAIWGGLAGLGVDALGQDIEDYRHLWVMIGLAIGRKNRDE